MGVAGKREKAESPEGLVSGASTLIGPLVLGGAGLSVTPKDRTLVRIRSRANPI